MLESNTAQVIPGICVRENTCVFTRALDELNKHKGQRNKDKGMHRTSNLSTEQQRLKFLSNNVSEKLLLNLLPVLPKRNFAKPFKQARCNYKGGKGFCCTRQFHNPLLKYLWRRGFLRKTKENNVFERIKGPFSHPSCRRLCTGGTQEKTVPLKIQTQPSWQNSSGAHPLLFLLLLPYPPCHQATPESSQVGKERRGHALIWSSTHTPSFELQHCLLDQQGSVLNKQDEWTMLPLSPPVVLEEEMGCHCPLLLSLILFQLIPTEP